VETQKGKLSEEQINLWIELYELSVELYNQFYNPRFQKYKAHIKDLKEAIGNTKAINHKSYNCLINKVNTINNEIIYKLKINRIEKEPYSIRNLKISCVIFNKIYSYKLRINRGD